MTDLIYQLQADSIAETEELLQKVFNTPINVKDGAMIRHHSINGPGTYYFIIQVHHITVDGEGFKRICEHFSATALTASERLFLST